jgi:sporulation protein YlmC with PRC-barrel domain
VIVLAETVDPDTLPRFVREHYTPIDDETGHRLDIATGYMWRYPTGHTGPFPMYPSYPLGPVTSTRPTVDEPRVREELTRNEVIGTRTPVISTDGEKVGSVSEVLVNDDGQLSHLVVDLGFLSGDKVLPAHWVEEIESDGIRLAVSNTAVESLETIT